jgi:thymidylate kinase
MSTRSVAVDIISEHRRSGLILRSGIDLVSARRRRDGFWVADPATEFSYLLAKKTWKGTISERQASRIRVLVEELGETKARKLAHEIFPSKLSREIVKACSRGSIGPLLKQVKAAPRRTSFTRHPLNLVRYLFGESLRILRRWFQPTGLFVVVLGPDGVGKSTLVKYLAESVGPAFRRYRVFHWRPMLLWRQGRSAPVTAPHELPRRASLSSAVRPLAYFLDHWLGHALIIRPLLARTGLVIFDRYFHDVLVDPKRYRYGGPRWLVSVLSHLVPTPDLVLILDASEQAILSRKQEVATEEIQTQRKNYLSLKQQLPYVRIIDANVPLPEMLSIGKAEVIECLAQRFQKQQSRWLMKGRPAVHPHIQPDASP